VRAVNLLPPDTRGASKVSADLGAGPEAKGGAGPFVVLGVLAACVAGAAGYVLTENTVKQRTADLAEATAQQQAIARQEGATPTSGDIRALVSGRAWLFGEYDSYVDASHLFGILRLAIESACPETLSLALAMAEYGCCLSGTFRPSTQPPFDDYCRDHVIYLKALLGQDVDGAIDHFRKKEFSAEVLVRLLLRVGRSSEAVEVFEQHLLDRDPAFLSCPDLAQLCRQAGDWVE